MGASTRYGLSLPCSASLRIGMAHQMDGIISSFWIPSGQITPTCQYHSPACPLLLIPQPLRHMCAPGSLSGPVLIYTSPGAPRFQDSIQSQGSLSLLQQKVDPRRTVVGGG